MAEPREHAWLTVITDSAQNAVIVIDKDRIIRYANKSAATVAEVPSPNDLVGHSYDEVLGRSQIFEEDGSPANAEDFPSTHALKRGVATSDRIYERVHDGKHAWLSIDAVPIRNDDGTVGYCIVRFTDVTDSKWRRDRLEFLVRSEKILSLTPDYHARLIEKARLTVPNLADWCTLNTVQRDGTLRRITIVHRDPKKEPLVQRLAELSEAELGADAGMHRVIRTGEPSFVPDIPGEYLKTEAHTSDERRLLMEQLQACSSMTLPIVSRGSVLGALTVAYAESRRHYTERDLEFMSEFCYHLGVAVDNARLYEDIQARDVAKDEFLAALSHELRNPLAPIKSSLELLLLSNKQPELQEELDLVQRQFDHLTSILNDLLDVTRYVRGKIRLESERVDLAQLLRDVAHGYAPLAKERAIDLETMIPAGMVFVWGDPVRLRQAVMNLLDNAQKFTPARGSIRISLEKGPRGIMIRVRDTGIGIPPDEIDHIFELHFQGSSKLGERQSGLGLGLVLVKNIVDLHGGSIAARSEGAGAGTELTITLPELAERTARLNDAEAASVGH